MSDQTDAITASLNKASTGLGEAQKQVAAAGAKADEIAIQAHAQYGMHAVARQLKDVSEILQAGYGMLGTSAQTLARAAAEVGKVHAGMSPGLVIQHLTKANGEIDTARTQMFAGLDQLDNAITRVHAALDGAQPGPLVGMIESAKQTVRDPALREANTAQDAINAVIAGGGQLGNA
jgi:hypothetical protein